MKYLDDNFDPKGYSIWHLHYDKLDSECKVDYLTRNLCNNFLDKSEFFRKYVYAVHTVTGEEGDYEIQGVWMWKGTEKLYCLDQNPSAEYYKYRKLDLNNDADRKLIAEVWCGDEDDKVGGKNIMYTKQYK